MGWKWLKFIIQTWNTVKPEKNFKSKPQKNVEVAIETTHTEMTCQQNPSQMLVIIITILIESKIPENSATNRDNGFWTYVA